MAKMSRRDRKMFNMGKRMGHLEGYAQGLHDGNPFIIIGETVATMANNISKMVIENPEIFKQLKEAEEGEEYEDDN